MLVLKFQDQTDETFFRLQTKQKKFDEPVNIFVSFRATRRSLFTVKNREHLDWWKYRRKSDHQIKTYDIYVNTGEFDETCG